MTKPITDIRITLKGIDENAHSLIKRGCWALKWAGYTSLSKAFFKETLHCSFSEALEITKKYMGVE